MKPIDPIVTQERHEALRKHFAQLCDLPPEDRARRLQSLQVDASMRSELKELLAADEVESSLHAEALWRKIHSQARVALKAATRLGLIRE